MVSYRFGEIVYILYPHPDHSGATDRPTLVISCPKFNREHRRLVLLPITSQLRHGDTFGTVIIRDWQKAGLTLPSVIKPFPHTAIHADVRRKVGELAKHDKDQVRQMLADVLSSNF